MNKTILKPIIIGMISLIVLSGFNTSLSENIHLKREQKEQFVILSLDDFYKNEEFFEIFPDGINENYSLFNDMIVERDLFDKNPIEKIRFVPGEFIVKFKSDINFEIFSTSEKTPKIGITSIDALNKKYNVFAIENLFKGNKKHTTKSLDLSNIYKFKVSNDCDILKIIEEYNNDLNVEYAEPNYIYHTCNVPDDPYFEDQWALNQSNDCDIDAPEAWDIGIGSSDITIAIIDTGVDYAHEDLADNIWKNENEIPENDVDDDGNDFIDDIRGWDFVDIDTYAYELSGYELLPDEDYTERDDDPMDVLGHGTHCAGIANGIGNNGVGISGVCWNCKIMPVRAGFKMKYGPYIIGILENDDIFDAICYAVENGADVISMSWGSTGFSITIKYAIDYAYYNGVKLVASAGNENHENKNYPAGLEKVIAVAASDQNDNKASFSNYGSWVDVAAPGVDIISTLPDNKYGEKSGTSMACPHVAGLVALIISRNPSFTSEEITTIIHSTTDAVSSDTYIGIGRINAYNVIQRDSSPVVKLNSSLDDAVVHGFINISGSATDSGFQNLSLYVGKGIYPTTWLKIYNSTIPVSNNIFTSWDTSIVEDGVHTIKLEINDIYGQISQDGAALSVKNINIAYPSNNDIFRLGDIIEINGSFWKSNFKNYTIEYGVGSDPTTWFTKGINLTNDGHAIVTNATFGTWNTSIIQEKNFYTLRITMNSIDSQSEYIFIRNIYLDSTLKKGWPQRILNDEVSKFPGLYWWPGLMEPVISDINNDGLMEVIVYVGGEPLQIYVFNPEGNLLTNWPVDIEGIDLAGGNIESPTVTDIDQDGYKEILVNGEKKIFIYNHSGCLVNTISFPDTNTSLSTSPSPIVAADLDNDDTVEIIRKFKSQYPSPDVFETDNLAVFDSMGNLKEGWPQTYFVQKDPILVWGDDSTLAIGDFDDDPEREIVMADNTYALINMFPTFNGSYIYIFDLNGSIITGFPKYVEGKINSLAVADITNDGYDEIIFAGNGLNVMDRFGNNVHGWPQLTGESIMTSPAIADFNNDGSLEIVVSTTGKPFSTYVFDNKGNISPGWPQQTSWNDYRSPVVGDVNGDGNPDVITTASNGVKPDHLGDGGVYAWNFNGTMMQGFPKVTEMDAQAAATIADIDNDGLVELIASSNWDKDFEIDQFKHRSSLYIWELHSSFNQETMEWPMFHHDSEHTGLYVKSEKDYIPPIIKITKPEKALYLFNFRIRKYLIRNPLIIGKINITVNATDDESGIERVEFFIDGESKENIAIPPYTYMWKRDRIKIFGHKHTITVAAYDKAGNSNSDEIKAWKFL